MFHWIVRLIGRHKGAATICLGLSLIWGRFIVTLLLRGMQSLEILGSNGVPQYDTIDEWMFIPCLVSYFVGILVTIFGFWVLARGS